MEGNADLSWNKQTHLEMVFCDICVVGVANGKICSAIAG
jgi:hypothetical protein